MKSDNISKEQVKHIAKLANLPLTDEEIKKFQYQLSEIIAYVNEILAVDTKNVIPTSHVLGLTNIVREDKQEKSLTAKEATKNAKETESNFIKTDAVVNE